MSSLLKNILLALGLALILWLGYRIFFATDDAALTENNSLIASEAARDTQEFLTRLQQLRNIKLDATIFADDRFRSFVDHRQEIVDEPVGRTNPFAPIGR